MDCHEAQEHILESFDGAHPAAEERDLGRHLSLCPACARFAARQNALDQHLAAALRPPQLSPGFRAALRRQILRQPQESWPDSLPDVAHLAGCAAAIGLCLVLLPWPAAKILPIGVVATVATYFVQAAVRSSFEDWEETG